MESKDVNRQAGAFVPMTPALQPNEASVSKWSKFEQGTSEPPGFPSQSRVNVSTGELHFTGELHRKQCRLGRAPRDPAHALMSCRVSLGLSPAYGMRLRLLSTLKVANPASRPARSFVATLALESEVITSTQTSPLGG